MRTLTFKQQRFVEEYMAKEGNGLQAAKAAGYKGNDNTLSQRAHELVRNSKVKQAIAEKTAEMTAKCDKKIASRLDRQAFWTEVMADKRPKVTITMADRLRASELLGKSEADFTENISTVDKTKAIELTERETAEAKRIAAIRLRPQQGQQDGQQAVEQPKAG